MKNYPDYNLVQKCLLQIETRLAWGKSDQWHNEVFIELSEKIQEETDVLLSPTTLKRLWGKVNYNSAPSINTLNTIAHFAGYTNWRDFKSKATASPKPVSAKKSISNRGIIITSAAGMTLLFISLFSLISFEDNTPFPDSTQISFSSRPIAKGLPNSVVFDFNLGSIKSDSIYIQQFWDVTKTIKIKADQKQATGIYYYPGYYKASLLVEGKSIQKHDLFIKTDDWVGTIDYDPVPKYIYPPELLEKNIRLPAAALEEIQSSSDPLVSSFHLVDDFKNISGDDFLMETSFRNIYRDKWAVCQSTKIVILGTTGAMIIPFSIPGCVSDIGLMLNDFYWSGKEHDLSAFGLDLSDFRAIKIEVIKKTVKVSVDGAEVYTGAYTDPIGRLIGIRYRFMGAGEVRQLKVMNEHGKELVDFGEPE